MMIELTCDNCGKKLRLSDKAAGTKGSCPQCNALIVVPGAMKNKSQPYWAKENVLMWFNHLNNSVCIYFSEKNEELKVLFDELLAGRMPQVNKKSSGLLSSIPVDNIEYFFVEDNSEVIIFHQGFMNRDTFLADTHEEAKRIAGELSGHLKMPLKQERIGVAEASIFPGTAVIMVFLMSLFLTIAAFSSSGKGPRFGKAAKFKALIDILGPNAGMILLFVGFIATAIAVAYYCKAISNRGMMNRYQRDE